MWKLKVMDHIADTICFEYEFGDLGTLMKFISINDTHNIERCKYLIIRHEEELPFAEPLGE